MSWKEKFTFLAPSPVEHTVGDITLNFYPMSVRAAFRLQTLAGPILEAVTVLLTRNDADCENDVQHNADGSVKSLKVAAVGADLAELRTNQRKAAVRKAVETLLDPRNAEVLGSLLTDSLRDDFDRSMAMKEKVEFVNSLTVGALTDMIGGLFAANKRVFAPLAEKAGGLLQAAGLQDETPETPED